MSKRAWAKIVGLAVALSWGVSFISIGKVKDDLVASASAALSVAAEDVPAAEVVLPFFLIRFAVTAACFIPVVIIGRREIARYDRRTWGWVVVLGLLLGPAYHLPLNFSAIRTPTALMSLVVATAPVMTAVLARAFIGEDLSLRRIAGMLLSGGGVVLALLVQNWLRGGGGLFELGSGGWILYPLLALGSALAAALWAVCGRAALRKRDPVTFVATATVISTVLTLFLWSGRSVVQVASLTGWGWVALLYLAVVATFLAYIGWYWSLMHLDASELTVFLNVIPVEALALGALVRGESMHPLYLVGAGVIIIGVYLTQSSSAPPAGGAGGDAASGPSAPEVGTGGAGEETWTQR